MPPFKLIGWGRGSAGPAAEGLPLACRAPFHIKAAQPAKYVGFYILAFRLLFACFSPQNVRGIAGSFEKIPQISNLGHAGPLEDSRSTKGAILGISRDLWRHIKTVSQAAKPRAFSIDQHKQSFKQKILKPVCNTPCVQLISDLDHHKAQCLSHCSSLSGTTSSLMPCAPCLAPVPKPCLGSQQTTPGGSCWTSKR